MIAAIGPTTAAAAQEVGLKADIVPKRQTASALAAAIGEHFAMAKSAR